MPVPVYYADHGVRTRQGLFWFVALLLLAHLCLQVLAGVRTGWSATVIAGVIWTTLLMAVTARALRQLEAIERDQPQPSAPMKLAFNLTLLVPIVGTVPLFFPSFRSLLAG